MNIEIPKQTFINVGKINMLKSHQEKLSDYEISDGTIKGKIVLEIVYSTTESKENYDELYIDYEIILDNDVSLIKLDLKSMNLELIEGQGLNCNYELDLCVSEKKKNKRVKKDEPKESKEIIELEEPIIEKKAEDVLAETLKKDEAIKINENIINEEKKEILENNYDELLEESLERDKNVNIITTKNANEESFMKEFDNSLAKRYKIKTITIANESEIDEIAKKYNVDLKTIYKNYDQQKRKIIIRIQE